MASSSMLPHNIEAEQAFLGILLNFPEILQSLSLLPRGDDFFLIRNRVVFEAVYVLFDSGKQIDIISVKEHLYSTKNLEKAGGPAYIAELMGKEGIADNIEYYISVIIEKSQRRQLVRNAHKMLESASDESTAMHYLLEKSEQDIFSITSRTQGSMYQELHYFCDEFTEMLEKLGKSGEYAGISTGFSQLDSYLTGLQKGELIIIGARPSVGKTALALNMAKNIAVEQKRPTGFFSLEMSGRDIIMRLACMISGISGNKIRKNMLSQNDIQNIMRSIGYAADAPLYISEVTSMSLFDLRIQARRLVVKEKVEVIFIDYLGLIVFQSPYDKDSYRRVMRRFEEVAEISRSLKALARELQVPIVVLSQLNRDIERSDQKEPTLANIRDSGAIEQDADVVLLLHKNPKQEGEDSSQSNRKLIIAKQRNGPVGAIYFQFLENKMNFLEVANASAIPADFE